MHDPQHTLHPAPHHPAPPPSEDAPPWQRLLAERLRALRIAKHLSVKQLAAQARMYWVELDRYERALQMPEISNLYTLAKLLDTDLHALLPATDAPHTTPPLSSEQ